jgi:hypothetical protein
MLRALTAQFTTGTIAGIPPAERAEWLFDAVAELVELLSSPSLLEARARQLGATWPDAGSHPTFAIEGSAWMASSAACSAEWTPSADAAWRQAWLLLSDVLAVATLAPFGDDCR